MSCPQDPQAAAKLKEKFNIAKLISSPTPRIIYLSYKIPANHIINSAEIPYLCKNVIDNVLALELYEIYNMVYPIPVLLYVEVFHKNTYQKYYQYITYIGQELRKLTPDSTSVMNDTVLSETSLD